ncbi:hypothetical protein [Oceanobacillus kimchii]|uniref:hypothetical protein n=1 Tax=Oceanobacillus kimchii TaxID=746691 RepID=UPI000349919D|nr:hypothetical protein [Oceanobacillus kimchii]
MRMVVIIIVLLSVLLFSCNTSEDDFLVNVLIEIDGEEENYILEISTLDKPKHMDFTSGSEFFLYEDKPLNLKLEENINYSIVIYSTTQYLKTDNKYGDQLMNYLDKHLLEKEISLNESDKEIIIEVGNINE